MDDDLKPGELRRVTKPLNFQGSPVLCDGSIVTVISAPDRWQVDSSPDTLLLHDDRLLVVPDWWLRPNSVVV